MKFVGAMFFEEQADIFEQLIISQTLLPVFVLWYIPKKILAHMSIKCSTVKCLSNAVVNVPHNSWGRTMSIADIE